MRKVLAMMKVPTNSAMKPNTNKKVLKNASPSWISPASASAALCPESTLMFSAMIC